MSLLFIDVATMTVMADHIAKIHAESCARAEQFKHKSDLHSLIELARSIGYSEACNDMAVLLNDALSQQPKGAAQ